MNPVLATPNPQVETLLPLTTDEQRRFKECEKVIQRGIDTFYEVGNALAEIRNSRLYRISYATFEDYCRERWQMSRFYAHRLIDSAQVVDNLLPIGNVPTNEAQARELAALEPEMQKAVWHVAISTAPKDDEGQPKITASHINSVKNVLTEIVKAGGMDDGSGEMKPIGVLVDSAVTEETYERLQRQKEYIKEHQEKEPKPKKERVVLPIIEGGDVPILCEAARGFLDDYAVHLAEWSSKIPDGIPQRDHDVLEQMIYEQGADALRLRKRTLQSDCEFIIKVMSDTEAASHTGEMEVGDLYRWIGDLRYFLTENEYRERLEYMNRDNVRMALLTDAGDGKQDDRRGKLPGIVCVPWRKVWDQRGKVERDEDED